MINVNAAALSFANYESNHPKLLKTGRLNGSGIFADVSA